MIFHVCKKQMTSAVSIKFETLDTRKMVCFYTLGTQYTLVIKCNNTVVTHVLCESSPAHSAIFLKLREI